jgi:hypothetical protein
LYSLTLRSLPEREGGQDEEVYLAIAGRDKS